MQSAREHWPALVDKRYPSVFRRRELDHVGDEMHSVQHTAVSGCARRRLHMAALRSGLRDLEQRHTTATAVKTAFMNERIDKMGGDVRVDLRLRDRYVSKH